MPLAFDLPQAISGGSGVANRRVAALLKAMRDLAAVLAIPEPLPKAAFAIVGLVLRGGQGERRWVLERVEDVGQFGVLRARLASTMSQNAWVLGGGAFGSNPARSS